MSQIKTLLLLSCLLLLIGCGGNPITKDNYSQIKTGMTLDEVESLLGSGTEQASSDASFGGIAIDMKSMVWQDEDKIISITFSHDKVQAKSQIGL
ncbi:MAG: outer membrane protein assembly factor BamE [Rubripirellula sp.]